MKGRTARQLFTLIIVGILFLQACRGSRSMVDSISGETFRKSRLPIDSLEKHLSDYHKLLYSASGKGKVIIDQPGSHERGTLIFDANRQKALIRYKNGLGIEGGRMLIDGDSVLVYNRIEKTARKMTLQDYSYLYLNGVMPMNPITLLAPDLSKKKVRGLYENEHYYYILFKDGTRAYLDHHDWSIRKIVYPFNRSDAITNFMYNAYAHINGLHLPRKIQMTSHNGQSSLFLMIQSLEINPKQLDFDLDLPKSITIQRL